MFFPLYANNSFLPVLAPNHGGDLQYCEPDSLAGGIKKCASSRCAIVFTEVFLGRDAPDSSYGAASFPPIPPHVTGPTLNAVCEYLGREGRKRIHKPNSSTAITLRGSEQRQCGLQPLFPPPEQQQDQDANNRGRSLNAIIFQPLRPDPLAHRRSPANTNIFT